MSAAALHETTRSAPSNGALDRVARRMKIGGVTRLTTLDYPGELAAVIYCQGCPWRCRYCHNGGMLGPAETDDLIEWEEVLAFLYRRQGLLDAVVFSGGEPTAQGALSDAAARVRGLGFKVGLHTGGAYPGRLGRLLPLVDWVGLDIKGLPEQYPEITGVPGSGEQAWASLALLVASGLDYEVRTTIMPNWNESDLTRLSEAIADAGARHYRVQACDAGHALDPTLPAQPLALAQLTSQVDPRRFDSFSLRGH